MQHQDRLGANRPTDELSQVRAVPGETPTEFPRHQKEHQSDAHSARGRRRSGRSRRRLTTRPVAGLATASTTSGEATPGGSPVQRRSLHPLSISCSTSTTTGRLRDRNQGSRRQRPPARGEGPRRRRWQSPRGTGSQTPRGSLPQAVPPVRSGDHRARRQTRTRSDAACVRVRRGGQGRPAAGQERPEHRAEGLLRRDGGQWKLQLAPPVGRLHAWSSAARGGSGPTLRKRTVSPTVDGTGSAAPAAAAASRLVVDGTEVASAAGATGLINNGLQPGTGKEDSAAEQAVPRTARLRLSAAVREQLIQPPRSCAGSAKTSGPTPGLTSEVLRRANPGG